MERDGHSFFKSTERANSSLMTREMLQDQLEKMFPPENTLISRRDPILNKIVAGGTLANADSAGKGIDGRIIIGCRTFYKRTAMINWILDRAKR